MLSLLPYLNKSLPTSRFDTTCVLFTERASGLRPTVHLFHEFCLWKLTLVDDALERASCDFRVIGDRYSDSSVGKLSAHNDVTSCLSHDNKAMALKSLANLFSGQHPHLRHARVPISSP